MGPSQPPKGYVGLSLGLSHIKCKCCHVFDDTPYPRLGGYVRNITIVGPQFPLFLTLITINPTNVRV